MSSTKTGMNELVKELTFLSTEAKSKREEIDQLKNQIKKTKFEYNQKIKSYHSLTNTIISQEQQMEDIQNKISKFHIKQQILLTNITPKCYNHLIDISKNESHLANLKLFFKLSSFDNSKEPVDLIRILKNETGIKSMLEYCETIYSNLFKEKVNEYSELYNLYQKSVNCSSTLNQSFPFDILFEYLGYVFGVIELKSSKATKQIQIEKNINEKNAIFLKLKALEGEIQKNDSLYKTVAKYVKGINVLLEKFNAIKTSKNPNNEAEIENLMKTIEQIKKFDINNCIIYDNMSSLSVQSEYSYSEIASTKSNNSLVNSNISPFITPLTNPNMVTIPTISNNRTNDTSVCSKKNNSVDNKKNGNFNNEMKKRSFEIQSNNSVVANNVKMNSSVTNNNVKTIRHLPKSFQSQKNTVKISIGEKSKESKMKQKEPSPEKNNEPDLVKSCFTQIQNTKNLQKVTDNDIEGEFGTMDIPYPNGINSLIKNSICDEMIAASDDKNIIKISSEYITKMNMKNNKYIIGSGILKEQKKKKILKFEKSIDSPSWCSSSCSFSCI